MTKPDIKQLFRAASALPVDASRLAEQRLWLKAHIALRPFESGFAVRGASPFLFLRFKPMLTLAIIAALLASGGGVVAASYNDVPGDPLYGVKITVERAQAAVTLSSEAKANFAATLAARRLEELEAKAETKAEAGAEARAEVTEAIEAALVRFEDHVADMEGRLEELNAEAAVRVSTRLEAVLSDSTARLAALRDRFAESSARIDAAAKAVAELRARLNVEAREAENEVKAEVKDAAATAEAVIRARAEGKIRAAENKINEVERKMDRVQEQADRRLAEARTDLDGFKANAAARLEAALDVGATTTSSLPELPILPVFDRAAATAKLQAAVNAFAEAKARLEAKSFGEALVRIDAAFNLAHEAEVEIRVAANEFHAALKNLVNDFRGDLQAIITVTSSVKSELQSKDETSAAAQSGSSSSAKSGTDENAEAKVKADTDLKVNTVGGASSGVSAQGVLNANVGY